MIDKPETGAPLTAETVRLLRAGDLLTVTQADAFLAAKGNPSGSVVTLRGIDGQWIEIVEAPAGNGSSFSRFAFHSRPVATPAPVSGDGVREAVDQDVAILAAYARRLGPRSPFAGSITRVLAALTTHGAGVGSAGDAARQVILDFDVEEYVEGYEFRGDEGAFMPNEWTRTLITDAIHGLMSELCLALAESRQRLDGTEAG